jgi:hypothetical protein
MKKKHIYSYLYYRLLPYSQHNTLSHGNRQERTEKKDTSRFGGVRGYASLADPPPDLSALPPPPLRLDSPH